MMPCTAIHPLKILAAAGAAFVLWGLLFACLSSPAWAETITVNSTDDLVQNDDGLCTLREAITSANTDPTSEPAAGECANGSGDDVINFALPGTAPWTVNLTEALPDLASNISIAGPGADKLTVRRPDTAATNFRIFKVTEGSVANISGITISGGNVPDEPGGGIYNLFGTLTVSDSTISDNSATQGGGIRNQDGTLTVWGSTISDNSADHGGGILNGASPIDSTTITNSTISGNSATEEGGGVLSALGRTVIKFSTITKNTAPADFGSGVSSWAVEDPGAEVPSTSTEVLSTIISANTNTDVDVPGEDVPHSNTNSFDSKGYNLIGDGNATGAFNQTGDQTGVTDPKLDVLGSYGGPTQTHRLQSDSPAIDAGPPTEVDPEGISVCPPPSTDQRGDSRPQGSACDIGAFEWQMVTISIDDTSVAEGNSGTTNATFTVSLSKASAQAVTVSYATAEGTATAGTDYQSSSGTLTFAPGQTTQSVSVQVNGENVYEDDETFFVNLSNATNATISDTQGIGTINNDDNTAPTAEGDSYTTNEDTTLTANGAGSNPAGVLANDTDPDSDSLNAVLVSGPSHAATNGFTLNQDGSFSYTPAANFFGTDTFTYKANDGSADSNVATVTITVTSVNDAPTVNVAAGGSCGTNLRSGTINLTVNDPDGPAGSLLLSAASSNPRLVPTPSNVTFGGAGAARTLTATAVSGRTGAAVLTVTVKDGQQATGAPLTVNVRVGGNGNDTLVGDANSDILLGQNGADTLSGLGGKDLLCGGLGNDNLSGGADDDTLSGSLGNDRLTGGTGADFFSGGSGTDTATDFTAGVDTKSSIP